MLGVLAWTVVAIVCAVVLVMVLSTSVSGHDNILIWAGLILLSPVILPIWGLRRGVSATSRILSGRSYAKQCVEEAVVAEGIPIPRRTRKQFTRTVREGAADREHAATKRLATKTVIAHVERRPEFRAALPERFDPDSWFADELNLRYVLPSEPTLLEDAAQALAARGADTNANMLRLVRRWRSAWEKYYALSEGRRTKPQLTDIALRLPRPKG